MYLQYFIVAEILKTGEKGYKTSSPPQRELAARALRMQTVKAESLKDKEKK
jgi:hypothetical protein